MFFFLSFLQLKFDLAKEIPSLRVTQSGRDDLIVLTEKENSSIAAITMSSLHKPRV